MSEIKKIPNVYDGQFVAVRDYTEKLSLARVLEAHRVNDFGDLYKFILVYENGTYSLLVEEIRCRIEAIYNADRFSQCNDKHVVWHK